MKNLTWTPERSHLQYNTLDLEGKKVESLNNSLVEFKFLQHLNISTNNVVEITVLQNFDQLITLQVARNKVKNITIFTNEELFPNLKKLDLAGNKINELPAIKLPKLEILDMSDNKIEKHENFAGHPKLRILKLTDNKFKNFTAFKDLPEL